VLQENVDYEINLVSVTGIWVTAILYTERNGSLIKNTVAMVHWDFLNRGTLSESSREEGTRDQSRSQWWLRANKC
jgi:hypothetical protein